MSLNSARANETATLTPLGAVLIVGGTNGSGIPVDVVERLDPVSGKTEFLGWMANPRSGHTATLLRNGTVLIAGGEDAQHSVTAEAALYVAEVGAVESP